MTETRSREEIINIIKNTELSPEEKKDYDMLLGTFKQKVEKLIPDATIYSRFPIGPGVYHSGYDLGVEIKIYDCLKRLGIATEDKWKETISFRNSVLCNIVPYMSTLLNDPIRVRLVKEYLDRDDESCPLYNTVDVSVDTHKTTWAELDGAPSENYIIIYKDGVWYT